MNNQVLAPEGIFSSTLTLADFEQVVALEPLCYPNPWSREVLYNEFSNEISLRIALHSGPTLVAYCFNHLVLDELHLLNVAVAPQWRGSGLGSLLLSITLEEAKERGASRAFLEVRPSNTIAISLYEKFNFRRLGIRKCYYSDNAEDAILMEASLVEAD